jgi:carotenoid cleavage dioxygenase-like enzyme
MSFALLSFPVFFYPSNVHNTIRMIPKGGYHWFDGDGMLHGVRITKEGTANYINR